MNKPLTISPSAINTWFQSPRLFYYKYIMRLKSPPTIHLFKGNFVHKAIEDAFKATRYIDLNIYFESYLDEWQVPDYLAKDMTEEEKQVHYNELKLIFTSFANRFNQKIEMALIDGKVKDKNHAWNLLKPRLSEHKILDKSRNVTGIIDAIETNFDDEVYIVDYKTSKLYKHTITSDYIRQLSIYAYLYQCEFGKIPDYVAIDYLRYGEIFTIPLKIGNIGEQLVEQAKKDIDLVREKSQSMNIEDYPIGDDEFALRDIAYFEKKLNGEMNGQSSILSG